MKRLKVIERFKRRKLIKHCCRNCHFLTKYTSAYGGQPWDEKDRLFWRPKGNRDNEYLAGIPEENRSYFRVYKVGCHRDEWESDYDEGFSRQPLKEKIWRNREGQCDFVEYPAGKTFPDTKERHREKEERRDREQNSRSNKIHIALGVAGLVMAAIFGVLSIVIGNR